MLYLARRWLGYDPEEWLKLPWWKQEPLLEGILEELAANNGEEHHRSEPITDDAGLAAAGFTML